MAKSTAAKAKEAAPTISPLVGGRLPINMDDLFDPSVVESDRVEFKEGWNPDPIIRSICAFANDFQNLGGGYIVIGVAEKDGKPVRPAVGVQENQLDKIQKELLQYCNLIQPTHFPLLSIEKLDGQTAVVLWVPGGQNRPYRAPDKVTAKDKEYFHFIRRYANSVKAKDAELKELVNLAANVPFDDRMCQKADLDDLKPNLIRSHLKEIGSGLYESSAKMDIGELGRRLAIVDGGKEYTKPRNVGLMFFHESPETWFPGTQIDIAEFPEGAAGKTINEKIFKGPIQQQLRDALAYLKNSVIQERVTKVKGKAEATRVFNYPFAAVEEAIVNAVYHRSYEQRDPVEVQVHPDKLVILSYPGPDGSIRPADLNAGLIVPRRYRNRRIGEFLKELKLTEGRGTGIPTIREAMKQNGNPKPSFKTDDDRTYFLTELPIQSDFAKAEAAILKAKNKAKVEAQDKAQVKAQVKAQAESLTPTERRILKALAKEPQSISALYKALGYKSLVGGVKKALKRLEDIDAVALTIPDKPRSQNQKRALTAKGKRLHKEA